MQEFPREIRDGITLGGSDRFSGGIPGFFLDEIREKFLKKSFLKKINSSLTQSSFDKNGNSSRKNYCKKSGLKSITFTELFLEILLPIFSPDHLSERSPSWDFVRPHVCLNMYVLQIPVELLSLFLLKLRHQE